jgi:hypothetical protein
MDGDDFRELPLALARRGKEYRDASSTDWDDTRTGGRTSSHSDVSGNQTKLAFDFC